MIFYLALFVISCALLIVSGNWLVKSLSKISEFLGLKEFTVAFLLMSLATAAPELFIGISSAFRGISELSLGNILGQNIIHFTLAIFICVLVGGNFSVRSKTIRTTAFFSAFIALFPLILILDSSLSRVDGFILIGLFVLYTIWMIKKGRKYTEEYNPAISDAPPIALGEKIKIFFHNISQFLIGVILLLVAAQGMIMSAMYFAVSFNVPLIIIGVLIIGLGTALPEVYFAAYSAGHGKGEIMAGNLLGSTVVSTSLVLGLVSIISPINNINFFAYFMSRFTLFFAVILFTYFILNDKKVSKKEGLILLAVYIFFVIFEILVN